MSLPAGKTTRRWSIIIHHQHSHNHHNYQPHRRHNHHKDSLLPRRRGLVFKRLTEFFTRIPQQPKQRTVQEPQQTQQTPVTPPKHNNSLRATKVRTTIPGLRQLQLPESHTPRQPAQLSAKNLRTNHTWGDTLKTEKPDSTFRIYGINAQNTT